MTFLSVKCKAVVDKNIANQAAQFCDDEDWIQWVAHTFLLSVTTVDRLSRIQKSFVNNLNL